MDTLPSSQFRKRYASLLRPTIVTVNGHSIGVWQPHKGPSEDRWREALGAEPVPSAVKRAIGSFDEHHTTTDAQERGISRAMREFRPAPKPGRR